MATSALWHISLRLILQDVNLLLPPNPEFIAFLHRFYFSDMIKYLSESTLLQFISTLLSLVNPIVSCWQEKKECKWKLGYLWDFSPPWRNKSKKKRKKLPTLLKEKSNCIWQIIKRKYVIYYQTVIDWFPFVSLQIQLNVFFRNTVFSCQDLVKISQELNQFFINRLLEWQRLRHI